MTSTDTKSLPEVTDDSDDSPHFGTGFATRVAGLGGIGFLVFGLALYGVAAALLRWPKLLSDLGLTAGTYSYGRLLPAGVNALLFGWLTLALAAFVLHAVPRIVGARLFFPLAAVGVVGLMIAGVGAGVGAILLGEGDGGRFLEMPWFVDAALVAAYFGLAVVVTATARRAEDGRLPLSGWFLVTAPWMLFLSFTAGAVPGVDGVPGAIQGAFTGTAATGLWVALAGVGAGYHIISRVVPGAEFHERLGRIGFWSLLVTWPWTSARAFVYGPVGDWMGTLAVLFGAGVVVAAITIITDWAFALRTRWGAVAGSPALQLLAAGSVLFLAAPVVGLVASLHSVSAITQFTPWETAYDQLTIIGAFTFWGLAALAYAVPAESGRAWRPWMGRLVVWPAVVGVGLTVGSRLVGGLQQGYGWLAGVQSAAYSNFGDGWIESAAARAGADLVQAAGIAVLGLAALAAAAFSVRFLFARGEPVGSGETAMIAGRTTVVVRRAILLFGIAVLGAFILPAIDADRPATLLADTSRLYEEGSVQDRGRELYVSEGCWYCHTQQVRAIVTDVGLGQVSSAGDYAHDPPGTLGVQRVGPDLAHAGQREGTGSASFVLNHLIDPRVLRPWSVMPSYSYLTRDELTALAAYVAGLE
ncbi:MAG TPA: cbb3-type cytochrome c oxidase subunit I [Acidimicrobiia bacterium]|nr:cbb3-type cytochrome c oxidase subunit I [Acidimicrobiia bacterium]